jgi:hypothetical protein
MRATNYRLTVVGCAASWLLLGLHLPVLHEVTEHGRFIGWGVLAAIVFLTVAAIAALWVLLRVPGRLAPPSSPGGGSS